MTQFKQLGGPCTEFIPLKAGLRAGGTQELTVLIRVHPGSAGDLLGERPRLNLALVLDRSGSMNGEPIEQARQAAVAAIRQLHPEDRVSVVSFANDARIDVPSTLVTDPQRLIRVVENIRASGGTFLEGGWRSGAGQVAEHLDPGALNRIILLSDGQATHGVQNPREMGSLVAGLTETGISTTAMGFGSHYNETLMMAIAEAGDGNYLHIEDAGLLPTIFERELQGLILTTGRRVSLGLEPNSREDVEVAEVLNVLKAHQKDLVRSIYTQMDAHFDPGNTNLTSNIIKGFQKIRSPLYTQETGEKARPFRVPVEEKRLIRGMLFEGFRKALFSPVKFDSDSERRFSVVLENDGEVLKWFKPAKGVFQIVYNRSGEEYIPDFAVETKAAKFLCEPKQADRMDDDEILAKAKAAALWCRHASQHGEKPWSYLLIPHDSIDESKTLAGLVASHTFMDQ